MKDDAFKSIQQLCADTIGLDSHEVSANAWQRALSQRKIQTGSDTDEAYWQVLRHSKDEQQNLFELLIVTESWFFRDRDAFEWLTRYCRELAVRDMRLLSIPCAAGEEPYSMAMALLDAGFAPDQFHIDAYDINSTSLAKAERGLYEKNAFRGKSLDHCAHHFNRQGHHFKIHQAVRRQVDFSYGNLCTFLKSGVYHVIFCRNILIYMHATARQSVIENLKRSLAPNGVLFVGPAEIELLRRQGFKTVGPLNASALKPHQEQIARAIPAKKASLPKNEESLLQKARHYADEGSYGEAMQYCMKQIEEYGADPEAYFLLGLIKRVNNEEMKAKEYFLKSVYLKPDHYEALICLALIAERQGDERQAELYRERAKRSQASEGS